MSFLSPSQVYDWSRESALVDNDWDRLEPPTTFDEAYPDEYLEMLEKEVILMLTTLEQTKLKLDPDRYILVNSCKNQEIIPIMESKVPILDSTPQRG